jgi:PIN domain nuclease of toxin-antitoxin system
LALRKLRNDSPSLYSFLLWPKSRPQTFPRRRPMILLDTHTLIWLARDPSKLSLAASKAIRSSDRSGGLAISAMTFWELAWLATHARLNLKEPVDDFVKELTSRTAVRPITSRIAILANQLPRTFPSDPCDRLIGATAISEGMALITKDRAIRDCHLIQTIW